MSRYENGVHKPPTGFVGKLANLFGFPVAYFYRDDDDLAEIVAAYPRLESASRSALLALIRDAQINSTFE